MEMKAQMDEWKRYLSHLPEGSFPEVETRFMRLQTSKHCSVPRDVLRYDYSYLDFRELEDEVTYLENTEVIEERKRKRQEALEQSQMRGKAPRGF